MRFRTLWGPLAATALVATLLAPSAVAQVSLERVVVVLRDGTGRPASVADDLVHRSGGSVSQVWNVALRGFAAEVPSAAIEGLRRDPRVATVEADRVFTAFGEVPTGVDRIEDDKKLSLDTTTRNYATSANSVKVAVAVIDTGIATHPDLNIVGGAKCASFTGCTTGLPGDGNGHGTHVAGTIGAKDDGVGVVGVIPGVDLYAVQVLSKSGSGYLSWIVAGLNWVAARAGTITTANMSLGASGGDVSLETAVRNTISAGVTVVVAAGNDGADASGFTPARVAEAITVGAVADGDGKAGAAGSITCRSGEVDDRFATFSNYGSVVDLSAPGVCITSTWKSGGFNTISGTSMATPHVTGAAALYRFENPTATPAQIQTALKTSASWSTSQAGTCGYTPYSSRTGGPLLMLAACDIATGGGGATATPPGDFSKVAPTNGGTPSTKGGGVTVSWASASGATSYKVCLNSASNCTTTTGTSLRLSGVTKGATYTWQVTAQNSAGSTEANGGTWWSFVPI